MDGAGQSGGGPAPFLLKTYDMVDDSSTDDIVSWSSTKNSFVVWNPPEFSRHLLPTYFKHNNFSSFIRQLNTYGFRKIDPERWEFANEEFSKDRKDLLKNIHRRKPIHSHSQPHSSFGETERMALEEEIDRLSREKSALQSDLLRFKQQQSGTLAQLEALERRVHEMEMRQLKMMSFLAKAVNNPAFVEHLIRMAGTSFDFSAINKKRRLPKADFCQEVVENSFIDNTSGTLIPDFGHIFHEDFSNKLKLELSSTVTDSNLLSVSAHSSTEDEETPHKSPEGDPEGSYMRTEGLCFATKTLELSDTGTSFSAQKNGFPLLRQMSTNECPEGEGLISCQLNLTLASSLLQVDRAPQLSVEERCISAEPRTNPNNNEAEDIRIAKNRGFNETNVTMLSSQGGLVNNNQGPVAAPGRVNDVFWEQFLTERPGSSDTEEASSSFRAHPYDEQEERKAGTGKLWRDKKDMEQLTL